MASIEVLDKIQSGFQQDKLPPAYHRAINGMRNSVQTGQFPEFFKLSGDQLDHVLAKSIEYEKESDKGFFSSREGIGAALKVFDIPSTALLEMPTRTVESHYAGKGIMKGIKETGEVMMDKRAYKTPAWQRTVVDIMGFPFMTGMKGAMSTAQPVYWPYAAAKRMIKGKPPVPPPSPKPPSYATYGTERGADIPFGAPHSGTRMGKFYGKKPTDWSQYTKPKRRIFYQEPLTPTISRHFGSGMSPIEQFEAAGGGLLDEIMKKQVHNIKRGYADAYTMGLRKMQVEKMSTRLQQYARPDIGLKEYEQKLGGKILGGTYEKVRGRRLPDGGTPTLALDNIFANKLRSNLKLTVHDERKLFTNPVTSKILRDIKYTTPEEAVREADRFSSYYHKHILLKKKIDKYTSRYMPSGGSPYNLPFTSKAIQAVTNLPRTTTPEQAKNTILKSASKEYELLDVAGYLKGKTKVDTKELINYLAKQGKRRGLGVEVYGEPEKVKIGEVNLLEKMTPANRELHRELVQKHNQLELFSDNEISIRESKIKDVRKLFFVDSISGNAAQEYRKLLDLVNNVANNPRYDYKDIMKTVASVFEKYTPGITEYEPFIKYTKATINLVRARQTQRETWIKLRAIMPSGYKTIEVDELLSGYTSKGKQALQIHRFKRYARPDLVNYREFLMYPKGLRKAYFEEPHYRKYLGKRGSMGKNVVMWFRGGELPTSETSKGSKIFYLQEAQSSIGQEARTSGGFVDFKTYKEGVPHGGTSPHGGAPPTASPPPALPYAQNWLKHGLSRMIHKLAKEGYTELRIASPLDVNRYVRMDIVHAKKLYGKDGMIHNTLKKLYPEAEIVFIQGGNLQNQLSLSVKLTPKMKIPPVLYTASPFILIQTNRKNTSERNTN